jgi:ABC-2 type transport system ATP-binding protein
MPPSSPAISVKNLTKSYGPKSVLEGISFEVQKGTVFALLGPNGAGKTTAVRIMTTLLKADSGDISVAGFDVANDADEVRSVIGLTGQNASVDDKLTGIANLEMIGNLYHLPSASAKARAKELIEQFDLVEAANRAVKTYSGGMRRRLDLAASLIAKPDILFLDEPTTGLDPRSRNTMWEIIRKLVAEGTTLLLTTQYLEEADQLADEIAVINNGKVIAHGTAAELKRSLGSDRLKLVFADANIAEKAATTLKKFSPAHTASTLGIELKDGFGQLRSIVDALDAAKLAPIHTLITEPTLDDVFLTLTGEQAAA